ncbi:MAG: ATP-binding cassette domain-containing protein [Actinobacteria bacterium]|nr:ATP-binding cassette domain-containing protein [Actinomycetota bacterium]
MFWCTVFLVVASSAKESRVSTLGFCNLTIEYDGVCAVNSFNDILHSGEWLCLIGPNGAGKSSVLRAAAGLVECRSTGFNAPRCVCRLGRCANSFALRDARRVLRGFCPSASRG